MEQLTPGFWREAKTEKGIPLMGKLGERRNVQIAEYQGLKASCKDPYWNKELNRHTCCDSRVTWRHKMHCPYANSKRTIRAVFKRGNQWTK